MATTLAALRQTVRERLLETLALTTPGSPIVSPQGTPGTTTTSYVIVAYNNTGSTPGSQATTITTSNANLNGTNFNRLTWQLVPGATGYVVYRTATNGVFVLMSTGQIGSTTTLTFDDTGGGGDQIDPPTVNTSGIDSPFWTEQEILDILILGCKDLWRAIIDLHQGHFTSINEDDVSVVANTTTLTGVPTDCFRVLMLEVKDFSASNDNRYLTFKPKQYHGTTFQAARAETAQSSGYRPATVYYDILNAGSPVLAPSIVIAPTLSSALRVRLVYVHVLPTLTETSNNPIPGESDNALISWTVAWARAKEREDRMPDPAWLATYSTDKQSLLTALTPRQEQEEETVEGLFY